MEGKTESKKVDNAFLLAVPGSSIVAVVTAKDKQAAVDQFAVTAGLSQVPDDKGNDDVVIGCVALDAVTVNKANVEKITNPKQD